MGRHNGARVAKAVLVSAVPPYLLQTESNPDGIGHEVFNEIIEGLKNGRPNFLTSFGKQSWRRFSRESGRRRIKFSSPACS